MREFGSEFPALSLPDNYFTSISQNFTDYLYLRSGRDSLGYVADNIADGNKVILLPAYSCESMIRPFTKRGWHVYFYSLNKDLVIDIHSLSQMIKKFRPSAVLTMNFFGIAPTDEAVYFIKKQWHSIVIIEDFTHCLFSFNRIYNHSVDYYVASIRKWLGVFDGALVLSVGGLKNKPKYRPNKFVNLRQKAQQEKAIFLITNNAVSKENFRKTLALSEEVLNDYIRVNCISSFSMALLKNINVTEIESRRKQNFLHLINELKSLSSLIIPDKIKDSALGCPFSLPVLIRNRDMIQKSFASKGLYTPVLWPINNMARAVCNHSTRMADNMLSIPIDQRYDYNDMEDIIKIIRESL